MNMQIKIDNDFAMLYFKRDIPCFQYTGSDAKDQAGKDTLKRLLAAVVQLANIASAITKGLSDHYPAKHNLTPAPVLKTGGVIRIPLDRRNPAVYITVVGNYALIPFVWYNSGETNTNWGRFESAIREAIRLL